MKTREGRKEGKKRLTKTAVPKVMTATLNVVVSINSTTVMQTYWTAPPRPAHLATLASSLAVSF